MKKTLNNLLSFSLFALLSSFSLFANSTTFPVTNIWYSAHKDTCSFTQATTQPTQACLAAMTSSTSCGGSYRCSGVQYTDNTRLRVGATTCPSDSTKSGSTCTPNTGFSAVNNNGTWSVVPAGSECPQGQTYNSIDGTCAVPPPPVCPTGQKTFSLTYDLAGVKSGYPIVKTSLCINNCDYTLADGQSPYNLGCFTSFAGSSESKLTCHRKYNGTGNSCTTPLPEETTINEPNSTPEGAEKTCPSGQLPNQFGLCMSVELCPADSVRNEAGSCVNIPCENGFERNHQNKCVLKPIDVQACPAGYYRDLETKDCKPEPDYSCTSGNACWDDSPLAPKNIDGSSDHDGNPNTFGANEPNSPRNSDGTRDNDGDPLTSGTAEGSPIDPNNPELGNEDPDELEEGEWGNTGTEGGEFELRNDDITKAKNNLEALYQSIKGELTGKFTMNLNAVAGLPCDSVDLGVLGTFELCISDYAPQLEQIGLLIMAVGVLLSIFIILA